MHLADRLVLPAGHVARPHNPAADHAGMARVLTEARRAKGQPELITVEMMDQSYANVDDFDDCDPDLDIVVIESVASGEIVGYCRPRYARLAAGTLDLILFSPLSDAARVRELFDACCDAQEAHLRKWIDGEVPARYRAFAGHPGPGKAATGEAAWLEARDYSATEWSAMLRRPHLDDVPDLALPDGVELRPAVEADLRRIVEAHHEAFRGEWDFAEATEQSYTWLLDHPWRDETLWQVAWVGDEVVGQVKPFINHDENAERGYRRGYAEFISTHADHRNRGIAGALLARALVALRERGMTEAVLGVDTNNPGGAFQLYTKLGFELETYEATYTKPAPVV